MNRHLVNFLSQVPMVAACIIAAQIDGGVAMAWIVIVQVALLAVLGVATLAMIRHDRRSNSRH